MTRTAHAIAALAALLLLVSTGAQTLRAQGGEGVAYLSGIEDLPLMPGLAETSDGTLVFDTPSGRIVDAYASGNLRAATVLDFYGATLPQLGWRRLGPGRFGREDEVLRLEFPQVDSGGRTTDLVVRFTLRPERAEPQGR